MNIKSTKAFTLIELLIGIVLVVVSVAAIAAVVSIIYVAVHFIAKVW